MARLVFMGTPRFGELVLSALVAHHDIVAVVTQPDREAGRGRKMSASAVKALALRHGLPILQPTTLRSPELLQHLRSLEPDVIAVAAYGKILPSAVLSLPGCGCLNVHASLLPRHRGAAPIPAAILAGDSRTGVTIMRMEEGLDTGPILTQAGLDIGSDDTTAALTEKLGSLGGQLLVETLPRWLAGEIPPEVQGISPTPYAAQLRREDGHICWTEPAEMIARRCRAFYPWPGAFAQWGERELKILRAQTSTGEAHRQAPGTVVDFSSGIGVVTGAGLLILNEVQLAGKRPMPAHSFVIGQRGFVGSVLN
jgi:methionyl-tRNA formyltransferase